MTLTQKGAIAELETALHAVRTAAVVHLDAATEVLRAAQREGTNFQGAAAQALHEIELARGELLEGAR